MAYTTFESDLLDAQSTFAYIPTGAILMLAAPYSTLSDSDLASLGLLKCDGTLHLVATYQQLYDVIGYIYGGSGLNFNVPNLHNQRLTIKGSSPTSSVGNITGSNTHQHSIGTVTWASNNNNTAMTHTHNAYSANRAFADGNPTRHSHNGTLASYNGVPNTDFSAAINGNTSNNGTPRHNHNLNYNAYNSSDSVPTAHTHTIPSQSLSSNTQLNSTGTAFTNAHVHNTTLSTSTTNQVTSGDPHTNEYTVPYSPMLYFIKA
jgi:microcystin-dependent protein